MGRIGQHSTESKECEEDQPHVKRRRQSRPTRQYLEDVIESLGNRFDRKCEETKLFPPQISANLKKGCIRAFQEATSERHLPIRACAVCAQLTSDKDSTLLSSEDKVLERVRSESGILVVDDCGRVGHNYRVCSACHSSLRSGSLPKGAILNGFDVGCNRHMPDYLKNLTEVEEMLIAKSRPFGKVRKLGGDSINYRHIGGHVIIVPEKVSTVYSVLPSRALSLPEVIKVVWVGKDQPTYKNLKPYLEVRREVVQQALLGLKVNNPVYVDIVIDEEFLRE